MNGSYPGSPDSTGVPPPPASYGTPPPYAMLPPPQPDYALKAVVIFVVILVIAVVLFLGGGLFLMTRTLGRSEPCRMALDAARSDGRVKEKLGTPIERGWLVLGTLGGRGTSGDFATLTFPVHGPRRKGWLVMYAWKRQGTWAIQSLLLRVEGERLPIVLVNGFSGRTHGHRGEASVAEGAKSGSRPATHSGPNGREN